MQKRTILSTWQELKKSPFGPTISVICFYILLKEHSILSMTVSFLSTILSIRKTNKWKYRLHRPQRYMTQGCCGARIVFLNQSVNTDHMVHTRDDLPQTWTKVKHIFGDFFFALNCRLLDLRAHFISEEHRLYMNTEEKLCDGLHRKFMALLVSVQWYEMEWT